MSETGAKQIKSADKEMLEPIVRRYTTLLEVSEAIATHRDLPALMHDLAPRLHGVVDFDVLALILHNSERKTECMHILEAVDTEALRPGIELPTEETPAGWVVETQEPLLVPDIEEESRFPRVISMMKGDGIRSFWVLPLTTSLRRLGALGFASRRLAAYADEDVNFMTYVVRQVAVAIDNVLHYEASEEYQKRLRREHDRLGLLLNINQSLVSTLDQAELFREISNQCRGAMQCDYVSLSLPDNE